MRGASWASSWGSVFTIAVDGFSARIGGFAASVHAAVTKRAISAEIKNNFSLIELLLSKCFEHLIGVLFDIYFIKDLSDLAIFVDQKRLPVYAHVLFSVHGFFHPDSVLFDNLFVGI